MKLNQGIAITFIILTILLQPTISNADSELIRSSRVPEYGVGMAGASSVVGWANALSFWKPLDEDTGIQILFTLNDSSPLQFGVGGLYKITVMGSRHIGFHVGGGLGLGTQFNGFESKFVFRILGNAGVHFSIPSLSRIQFAFDAGPYLRFYDSSTQFRVRTYSDATLGMSIHYMFY